MHFIVAILIAAGTIGPETKMHGHPMANAIGVNTWAALAWTKSE